MNLKLNFKYVPCEFDALSGLYSAVIVLQKGFNNAMVLIVVSYHVCARQYTYIYDTIWYMIREFS